MILICLLIVNPFILKIISQKISRNVGNKHEIFIRSISQKVKKIIHFVNHVYKSYFGTVREYLWYDLFMDHTVLILRWSRDDIELYECCKTRRENYASLFVENAIESKVKYEQFVNLRQRRRGKGFGGARPNKICNILLPDSRGTESVKCVRMSYAHIYYQPTHALFAIFDISKLHLCERKRLLAYTHIHFVYLVTVAVGERVLVLVSHYCARRRV